MCRGDIAEPEHGSAHVRNFLSGDMNSWLVREVKDSRHWMSEVAQESEQLRDHYPLSKGMYRDPLK